MTILALGVAILLPGAANAPAQAPDKMQADPKVHREVMPTHARLIDEQKQQDAEIEKLLAEMNSSTGETRIDAIIAVVNKLVEQRKAMQAKIAAHLDK